MLPTFIGIGPGRTATSMVYEILLRHPEIVMAKGTKETNFFSWEYYRGHNWYQNFFEEDCDQKIYGEISTTYFYDDNAACRIKKLIPNVLMFCCLRNPFDRLKSVYLYRVRSGVIPWNMPLESAINKYPDLLTHNNYYDHLFRYLNFFDKNQILVLLYDDLVKNAENFLKTLLKFIGANMDFDMKIAHRRVNESAVLRWSVIGGIASKFAGLLRSFEFLGTLDYLKRNRLLRNLFLKPVADKLMFSNLELSNESIQILSESWKPQLESVEILTDRDLSHWMEI